MRLNSKSAVVLVIDIQEKLLPVMANSKQVEKNAQQLLEGARLLDVATVFSEQYPRGLGATIASLDQWKENAKVYEKTSFSLLDDLKEEMEELFSKGYHQFIISGIETHVCVYQTARDLLLENKEVIIAYDAVGSRDENNNHWALKSLQSLGALILPTETILFDLQRTAKSPTFKAISSIIK